MKALKIFLIVAVTAVFMSDAVFAAEKIKNFKQAVLALDIAKTKEYYNKEAEKKRGKLVNNDNIDGTTPLIYAVSKGNQEFIEFILTLEAGINEKASQPLGKKYERTALLQAILLNNAEIVKYLIGKGADINYDGGGNYTPLALAAVDGKTEIIKILQGSGKLKMQSYSNAYVSVMEQAVKSKDLSPQKQEERFAFAKEYLSKGVSADTPYNTGILGTNETLLHMAAASEKGAQAVKFLIDNGADVNVAGIGKKTPLMYADGNFETVKLLVDAGAEVNAQDNDGKTPLMYSVKSDNMKEAVNYLLDNGAFINTKAKDGTTALAVACSKSLEMVKYFEDNGADFSAKKLLSSSVNKYNTIVLEYLLTKGIKPASVADADEALLKAADLGNFKAVKILLDKGLNVNVVSTKGTTLLFPSAEKGNSEEIAYLLKRGIKADVYDKDGNTPLMLAVKSKDMESVKLLVQAGAQVKRTDKKNKNAIDLAKDYKMKEYLKAENDRQALEAQAWDSSGGKEKEKQDEAWGSEKPGSWKPGK